METLYSNINNILSGFDRYIFNGSAVKHENLFRSNPVLQQAFSKSADRNSLMGIDGHQFASNQRNRKNLDPVSRETPFYYPDATDTTTENFPPMNLQVIVDRLAEEIDQFTATTRKILVFAESSIEWSRKSIANEVTKEHRAAIKSEDSVNSLFTGNGSEKQLAIYNIAPHYESVRPADYPWIVSNKGSADFLGYDKIPGTSKANDGGDDARLVNNWETLNKPAKLSFDAMVLQDQNQKRNVGYYTEGKSQPTISIPTDAVSNGNFWKKFDPGISLNEIEVPQALPRVSESNDLGKSNFQIEELQKNSNDALKLHNANYNSSRGHGQQGNYASTDKKEELESPEHRPVNIFGHYRETGSPGKYTNSTKSANSEKMVLVNMNKSLIENFIITGKNDTESLVDFKRKVEEVLIEILNNANAIK